MYSAVNRFRNAHPITVNEYRLVYNIFFETRDKSFHKVKNYKRIESIGSSSGDRNISQLHMEYLRHARLCRDGRTSRLINSNPYGTGQIITLNVDGRFARTYQIYFFCRAFSASSLARSKRAIESSGAVC